MESWKVSAWNISESVWKIYAIMYLWRTFVDLLSCSIDYKDISRVNMTTCWEAFISQINQRLFISLKTTCKVVKLGNQPQQTNTKRRFAAAWLLPLRLVAQNYEFVWVKELFPLLGTFQPKTTEDETESKIWILSNNDAWKLN